MKLYRWLLLLSSLYSFTATAFEPFQVKDIRVEGIQRTEPGTIFNYLPVRVGDTLTEEKAAEAVKSLYATGFFKDVRLEADGNVLVVSVVERPAISQIDFVGEKEFDKNKSNYYFKISDLIASLSIGRTLANFRSFIFDNYLNFAGNMDDVSRISSGFADLEVHISNTWKVEALRNTAKEENILTEQYCLNFMNKSRFRNKNKTGLY